MLKVCYSDSWDFGGPTVEILDRSSRGFIGHDRKALIKRSGEDFVVKAGGVTFNPGEIPLHVIAMGATEAYGPNRNGDGFKMAMLRACAPSFEKHARYYYGHANKDPKKSYGVIKLAFVNEPMKRVELLIGLNGTKEAAERNGGLVATDAIEKLARGDDLAGSMAARVPYDECSACGNRAKTRKDYCKSAEEGGKCKLFGCATGLTKVSEDGHIQHVDNPSGTFFDYSKVAKPADRIAYGNEADYLKKCAEEKRAMSGLDLAEMYGVIQPMGLALSTVSDASVRQAIKFAYALAAEEEALDKTCEQREFYQTGVQLTDHVTDPAEALTALAKEGILVSPVDFLRINGASDEVAERHGHKLAMFLPGVYSELVTAGAVEATYRNVPLRPIEKLSGAAKGWAKAQAAGNSLEKQACAERLMRGAFRGEDLSLFVVKEAAEDVPEEYLDLALNYAMYKLAFAPLAGSLLTPKRVVRHNCLS